MNRQDRERWASAKTLADLGELTAQWLEGTLASRPGYAVNAGPDPETIELIPVLARVNRAGFLTSGSQPGMGWELGYNGRLWRQRAFVQGFADDAMLGQIVMAVARCRPEGRLRSGTDSHG